MVLAVALACFYLAPEDLHTRLGEVGVDTGKLVGDSAADTGETGSVDSDDTDTGETDSGETGDGETGIPDSGGCDLDADGFEGCGGSDCNDADADAAVFPGAPEYCDEIDSDCDGNPQNDAVDAVASYSDADLDGYGDPTSESYACTPVFGAVANGDDCDDTNSAISPAAKDLCDSLDNNCDGFADGPLAVPAYQPTIQDAVDAAVDGDRICVAAGNYLEAVTVSAKSISVEGESAGTTTIDADGACRPFSLDDAAETLELTGFTLTGGECPFGAGLYLNSAGAYLADLDIANNQCTTTSDCVGTGLYGIGDFTIQDVRVRDNYAAPTAADISTVFGVGVYLYKVSGTIDGLTISGNVASLGTAVTSAAIYGVGLSMSAGNPLFTNLDISGNMGYRGATTTPAVAGYGGAIALVADNSTFDGATLTSNTLSFDGDGDAAVAGGIFAQTAVSTFAHLDMRDNAASANLVYGDAMFLYEGSVVGVSNAIFAANDTIASTLAVAAFECYSASLTLTNVDVYANELSGGAVTYGSAIYGETCSLSVQNSNIVGNVLYAPTGYEGAALYWVENGVSALRVTYSNIYGNSEGQFVGIDSPVGQDGNIAVDPTYTGAAAKDPRTWDLTLAAGSGAIDAGDPALTDVDGSRSDIGAYGGAAGVW